MTTTDARRVTLVRTAVSTKRHAPNALLAFTPLKVPVSAVIASPPRFPRRDLRPVPAAPLAKYPATELASASNASRESAKTSTSALPAQQVRIALLDPALATLVVRLELSESKATPLATTASRANTRHWVAPYASFVRAASSVDLKPRAAKTARLAASTQVSAHRCAQSARQELGLPAGSPVANNAPQVRSALPVRQGVTPSARLVHLLAPAKPLVLIAPLVRALPPEPRFA